MLKMFSGRQRAKTGERERLDAFHGFLRAELTKELRQAIKLVQTESATQRQNDAALLQTNQFAVQGTGIN